MDRFRDFMTEPTPVYLYRYESSGTKRESCTVLCAAPTELVIAVYGGGGPHNEEGVHQAFGGHLFYRSNETGQSFIAIWGARYASRFRMALRRKTPIVILRQPPPAHLVSSHTMKQRPPTSKQYGIN